MPTYTIHAAKTNLSKLVARAEAGEEIVLARGKDPVVKIVPVTTAQAEASIRRAQRARSVGPEFFEPLPRNELKLWK